MSAKYFRGGAATVAQVVTFTPGTVQIGDIFTITVTGEDGSTKAISFTATAATTSNVSAGLVAAWNASTDPLCTPITAADATGTLTLTADVAGVPFYVAGTTTDGGGANTQTLSKSTTTANAGPEDWNTAINWSDSTVPVSTDTVYIDGRAANKILYGMDQSSVTLAALYHFDSMALQVGQSTAPLKISATTLEVAKSAGDGSRNTPGEFWINTGSNQTTATIWNSRNSSTDGVAPVCLTGSHASNKVYVYGGTVGIGTQLPADAAQFPTIFVAGDSTKVTIGSGTTSPTTITQEGGTLLLRCGFGTIHQLGGTLRTEGSGTGATLNTDAKTFLNSTGTLTNLNFKDHAEVDTTETLLSRTITNATKIGGGKLTTNEKTTYTNGVIVPQDQSTADVVYRNTTGNATVTFA